MEYVDDGQTVWAPIGGGKWVKCVVACACGDMARLVSKKIPDTITARTAWERLDGQRAVIEVDQWFDVDELRAKPPSAGV